MKILFSNPDLNYFKLAKSVLDRSVELACDARGISSEDGLKMLAEHLRTMSEEWFNGSVPNIAYEDPFLRLAYVYCHVPANANLIEIAVRKTPQLADLMLDRLGGEGELRVCVLGGGPGTELLALAKHLWNKGGPQRAGSCPLRSLIVFQSGPKAGTSWNRASEPSSKRSTAGEMIGPSR